MMSGAGTVGTRPGLRDLEIERYVQTPIEKAKRPKPVRAFLKR